MPDRAQDLELFREHFIHQLKESSPQLQGHNDFMRYWKVVEAEAQSTEDLGKLDGWVKDLARDKEEIQSMKTRLEGMDERDPLAESLLNILRMLLDYLEGIYKRIRNLRDDRRSYLASLLWKAGPGVKPKKDEGEDTKKDQKKDGTVAALMLDKDKGADKKQPDPKQLPEKKMQR